ncbi:MAG TPA: hypothetical protein VGT05_01265 [Patescibacteria group bacterium]|nr:hypothetical protein [Patescibacteria group bacterium]
MASSVPNMIQPGSPVTDLDRLFDEANRRFAYEGETGRPEFAVLPEICGEIAKNLQTGCIVSCGYIYPLAQQVKLISVLNNYIQSNAHEYVREEVNQKGHLNFNLSQLGRICLPSSRRRGASNFKLAGILPEKIANASGRNRIDIFFPDFLGHIVEGEYELWGQWSLPNFEESDFLLIKAAIGAVIHTQLLEINLPFPKEISRKTFGEICISAASYAVTE